LIRDVPVYSPYGVLNALDAPDVLFSFFFLVVLQLLQQ
jgi:hypothetical protein